MPSSQVVLDRPDITFDDARAVAAAGLLLRATLAERLAIEQATDELVDLATVRAATPSASWPSARQTASLAALAARAVAQRQHSYGPSRPPASANRDRIPDLVDPGSITSIGSG